MIQKFDTNAAYAAAGYPTKESRVSEISEDNLVKIDGVNIRTFNPVLGDAVYKKDGEVFYFKGGDALNHSLLVANGYEGLGQIIGMRNGKKVFLDKTITTAKYLDVSQYAMTDAVLDGEEHSKTIGLRFGIPNWDTTTNITFTYTATTLAEVAAACTAAIEAKLAELSAPAATIAEWWAYADDANNRVIVQRDNCTEYRFYNCSGLTHITWGDMPASDAYFKRNGRQTNYRGLMNIARGSAYWSTNGRTPDSVVHVNGEAGNANPMTLDAYNTSKYAAEIRAYYPTYELYLQGEFRIMYPQEYGAFHLPSAKALGQKYGNATAPTKAGGVKFKFPALHYGLTVNHGVSGLSTGDLFTNGVEDGTIFMNDSNMATINRTRSKMGHTLISNGSLRWFAQRYGVTDAWHFRGFNGTLDYGHVNNGFQVEAVALLN